MNNNLRGERRICPCGELKFYDLNRSKLECPKCKKEIIIEALIKKTATSQNPFSQKTNVKDEPIKKELADENIDDEMETEDDTSTIVNIDE
jgi:hypothetical protein